MKSKSLWVMVVVAIIIVNRWDRVGAEQEAAAIKQGDAGQVVNDPTKKGDRMRRPGFLFLELDCHDLASHVQFFEQVAGFELNRKDGNFLILRSPSGEILLNGVGGKAPENPPRYQGPRVEIGIVVANLDKAFEQAKLQKGWTIQSGIARQPWNARDFRVYSPERYYLRITEGPMSRNS